MSRLPPVVVGNRRVELFEIGRVAFNNAAVEIDRAVIEKVRCGHQRP